MKNEVIEKIEPAVQERLLRAIRSLLNAGRNVDQTTDALSPQVSFGKYNGCNPTAIRAIATLVCREINTETAKINAEIRAEVRKKLNEDYPELKSFFKIR